MPAAHPLPPPPASKCGCGVCPAPQARAKRAPRATRATPAQAFRAPLRRKKRGLPLQQARRAIAPFALPPRQALPRLPLQAPGAPHPARASVSSVRRTQETRLAAIHSCPRRAMLCAPPVRGLESRSSPKYIPNPWFLLQIFDLEKESRASAGQAARFQRAACLADMRGGFGSLASARQPYAGRRPASRRLCRRRSRQPAQTPSEKIGASRAFPTRAHQRAFASLYTPSHHRIGNWITAAMAAVYSTHTSARPKCPPSRTTPLKYT